MILGMSTAGFTWLHVIVSLTAIVAGALVALVALYGLHLAGAWRALYVVTALAAFYLNTFVLVAQLFAKVPALKALAPTGSEPPFAVAQLLVLVAFVALGISALRAFRPAPPLAA